MQPPQSSEKFLWITVIIAVLISLASLFLSQYQISIISKNISQSNPTPISQFISPVTNNVAQDSCGPSCQAYINTAIENQIKVATVSGSASSSSTKTVQVVVNSPRVTYIPLSGGNTQSTSWTNLPNSQITFNINDYGGNANAIWDAALRVDNANGQTFARLFDMTHGIAVNGSQISVSNTSTSTDVISGNLSFWQGNNTYVVQLESLNGSTAFIDSGRIKINY